MKQLFFALLPAILLVACSTNPDGSVNWSDNPLNKVATKVDDGVQKLNHNTDKVIAKTGGGDRFGNHCVTCYDHKVHRTSKCLNGAISAAIPTIRNILLNVMSSLRATAIKRASRCASVPARILPNGRKHLALFSGCPDIQAA